MIAWWIAGLWLHPGLQDNDWPLLMWLAHNASPSDLAPLAIGHYGPTHLVLIALVGPLFGSTLIAAKVINTIALVGAGLLVHRLAARLSGDGWVGVLAMILFLASREAILLGQSEYADPIALCLYLGGLDRLIGASRAQQRVLGGVLLGLAAATRLHFQGFGVMTLGVLALWAWSASGERRGRLALEVLGCGAIGFAIGLAPATAVYALVHGTLGSPVAGTFLPQVILGVDDLDLPGTFARHTTGEVLAQHPGKVIALIAQRLLDLPLRWVPPLVAIAAGAALAATRQRQAALALALLMIGYYGAVLGPSFTFTPRVMLTLVALTSLALAAAVGPVLVVRWPRATIAALLLFALVRLGAEARSAQEDLALADARWEGSRTLTQVLREGGLTAPEEAFVIAWDRVLVDDPRLIGYYNFGFWNLLVPRFAAERPSPFPHLQDPEAFAAFVRAHGVRFVVVPKDLDRAPWMRAVSHGQATLPGYQRFRELPEEVVLRAIEDAPSSPIGSRAGEGARESAGEIAGEGAR